MIAVTDSQGTTPRLRVLFVINLNSSSMGGAEKQVITLLRALDTTLFTLGLIYLRADRAGLSQQLPLDRLAYVACSEAERYLDLGGIRRLTQQIDAYRPDIVVCTNSWSLLNVSLARPWIRHRFRLIEVFHTTTLLSRKQKLQMRLHYPLFRRSDLLVYVCNTQRTFWRRKGLRARADAIVYNGIDAQRFVDSSTPTEKLTLRGSFGFGAQDYVIGLCAIFRPEKAHADLLTAVAALHARGVPAKVLLIGDGEHRTAIEAVIRELGLAAHVRITGYVADVRPYVAICDVMTLVSHAIETFSIAALEAMAMGKPMVMSRVGGAEEMLRDGNNGRLYPAGDTEALTRHLGELSDPLLRSRYGAAAQANVRARFTTECMTQDFTACLLRVAAGSTHTNSARTAFAEKASSAPSSS